MFDFITGLAGLGMIFGAKAYDRMIDENMALSRSRRFDRCEEFYKNFVDEELENELALNCRSEENILKFKLACRDIGVSSTHDNITDFHRVIILLALENKLPKAWFCDAGYKTGENWYYSNNGFNFVWGDPNDIYATTKVLSWVNKMIYKNGSNINLMVFCDKRKDYPGYIYANIDVARREDSIIKYVTKEKFVWDCVLDSVDRIFNTKSITVFWNSIKDN